MNLLNFFIKNKIKQRTGMLKFRDQAHAFSLIYLFSLVFLKKYTFKMIFFLYLNMWSLNTKV